MSRMTLIGVTGALSQPFPDFDKILDFTSAGSESSTSVNVTNDLEYKILIPKTASSPAIWLRINNDSTASKYGRQYIFNRAGSISAARGTSSGFDLGSGQDLYELTLLAPTGFIKTLFLNRGAYTSGTTMGSYILDGWSFNSTSDLTSLNFVSQSGNFTAGTRIIVYRRRQN